MMVMWWLVTVATFRVIMVVKNNSIFGDFLSFSEKISWINATLILKNVTKTMS